MTKIPFILLLCIIMIHSTEGKAFLKHYLDQFYLLNLGVPSDYFNDLKSQGDHFMNQVSGFGAEVGEAGNRIVENISDGFNRVRNQDRGREEREDGDRSVQCQPIRARYYLS